MTLVALAEALAAARLDAAARLRAAGLHAADALAALDGGRRTGEGADISAFYAADGDDDLARATRAAGAAAVIRFSECDAIHLPSCVTPAASAVPPALSFAPDAERFAAAVEAGFAAGVALGESVGGAAALAHGVWPTLLAAPAIAAAATATALGLGPDRAAHAMALALAGASGRCGRPGGRPSGRWLAIGEATAKGIRAALAARDGFGGDLALVDPRWLRAQTAPELADPAALTRPPARLDATGLKPFVTARQGLNAIVAFQSLLAEGLNPDTVERVDVALPAAATGVVSRPLDAANRLSTIAHLGLQLGLAAYAPDRLFDIDRANDFESRALAFADRVRVSGEGAPDGADDTWPARVTVRLAGDGAREAVCVRAPGDAGDPEAAALVAAKIERLCPPARAAGLKRLLDPDDRAVAEAAALLDARPGAGGETLRHAG